MSTKILAKFLAAAVLAVTLPWAGGARASELVMFERAGCVWCQRWDRQVGASYSKSEEAQRLPLRRIDIGADAATNIVLAGPVRYTPTFVIVDQGREIGRITGYVSDDAFWGLLSALAAKLQPVSSSGPI